MAQVRVRFAPSPTGFFHIGSARTALFNWLYARHTGGVFVLRIEDTDAARNTAEFLAIIYESLRWLGLDWDEGPEAGGDFGPYRQSERSDVYQDYLARLRAAGRTYEKDGAVFFKISGQPQVIDDAIRGRVERTEEKDFVIVRSDGKPVFHLVNVVDDIAMAITHVIRGEDHLSNTSKHTELFHALGAPVPVYAHIPLILKQNGPGKMSKRDRGALVEEYRRRAFLPEALVNFLCLLGWNPKDDREKIDISEVIRLFDLPGVNQSNARFDEKKLSHMNQLYLQELPAERYLALAAEYCRAQGAPGTDPQDRETFREVALLAQPKLKSVEELPAYSRYFFTEDFAIDPQAKAKVLGNGDPRARLRELASALDGADFSSDSGIEQMIQVLAAAHSVGIGEYIHPGRLAVSGTGVGPSFYSLFRVLGRDRVRRRIERFLASD
jgi:glutamyl-tRNA synthetase